MKWPRTSRRKIPTRTVFRATMQPGDSLGGVTFNCYPRRDTWQRWYEKNPVLLRGEIGIALHKYMPNGVEFFVIGDGTTPWRQLKRYV